jgi:DNA (cytosine-5)-methyltransferase 1
MRRIVTAIDLFAGAGGVTTGYRAAGITVLAAIDTSRTACASYVANHPDVKVYADDLQDLRPSTLRRRLRLKRGELAILTACPPCQTFSSLSAKHRKRRDVRNRLVEKVVDFVEEFKPKAAVLENVPLLARHKGFTMTVRRLRRLGYGVWFGVVDAADFGVPQRRRRLTLIAIRGVADADVPEVTIEHPALSLFVRRRTVREAFKALRSVADDDDLNSPRRTYPDIVARRIAAIPKNGGSRADLPLDLQLECHRRLDSNASGNVYGRMYWDDVAPTLTTRCTTPACGRYLHPDENRAITLREAAILQSFPTNYRFEGGTMSIQSQIGNAMPPLLAEVIAKVVVNAISAVQVPV